LEVIGEDNNAAFDMSSIPADKLESPIVDIKKEINALEKQINKSINEYHEMIIVILRANTTDHSIPQKIELELMEKNLNKAETIAAVYDIFRKIQTADELIKSKKVISFDVLLKKIQFPEPVKLLKIAGIINQAEKRIQEIGIDKGEKEADRKAKEEDSKNAKKEADRKIKEEANTKVKEEEKAKGLAMKEEAKNNKWYYEMTSASSNLDLSTKGIFFI
jgi:hypothetical protein